MGRRVNAPKRAHLEKSLKIFGNAFKGWDIAQTLIYLGETHLRSGDDAQAKTIPLDSLGLARDIHSEPLILQSLAGLASLELRLNSPLVSGWLTLVLSHPLGASQPKGAGVKIDERIARTKGNKSGHRAGGGRSAPSLIQTTWRTESTLKEFVARRTHELNALIIASQDMLGKESV